MEFKRGSHDDPELVRFQQFCNRMWSSYSNLKVDNYYGNDEAAVVSEAQKRLAMPITGTADHAFLVRVGFISGGPPVVRSSTWIYTAPGTSGRWDQGPQFAVGDAVRAQGKQHQPCGYPAGGFLGLLGGDPSMSYNESMAALEFEWARLLRQQQPESIVTMDYSQSADGRKRAILNLFGDGKEFEPWRGRLKRVINFGDPTRQIGPTKLGDNPPGWGIARLDTPPWLDDLTYSITTHGDIYACTTDDTAVKLFYPWFVKAETSLTFIGYSAQIVLPAIASIFGLGGMLLGPAVAAIAGIAGMGITMVGQLVGSFTGAPPPDPALLEFLSAQGIIRNLPMLIKTLIALGGIATHGEYHQPKKPEFGNRTGIDVAIDLVGQIP